MKTLLISKQILSGFHSASTKDAWIRVLTNSEAIDFELKKGLKIKSKSFPFLNNEEIAEISGDELFIEVYLKKDETFYNIALNCRSFSSDYSEQKAFKELVEVYLKKGWKNDEDAIPEQTEFWKREEKRESDKMKAEGYVLWQTYDDLKKEPISVYKGGFSDELFNNHILQEYLSKRGIFGWIGNSSRKAYLDEAIEVGLKKRNLSEDKIAAWLTSTDGRHFADELSGLGEEEQLKIIDENLNRIFNLSLIFSSPFHKGTYESTCEIRKDYESQGILLPEDGSSYDAAAHFKLLADFFKAMGIKKKREE